MLKSLGKLIEKRPWLVIGIVLLVTVGFSTLIPSLEMKTDFKDFMPDDEVVQASMRISNYFGENEQIMFVYVEKEQTKSTITPDALREQYYIEKELLEMQEVEEVIGISTLVDQICLLEFGEPFENCTDEQLEIVVDDIFEEELEKKIQILDDDDPNEEIDYKRFQKFSRGKTVDSIDIKNCQVEYNDESIIVSIEVYDLSFFEDNLRSPIYPMNVIEWYIDFENYITPDERLDVSYRLAVHLEPMHPVWEIGKGVANNLKTLLNNIQNHELLNFYKKEAYLWVKPATATMYFPMPLKNAQINFNTVMNRIELNVPREEIGSYGIAPRFGAYELPAKLSDFRVGTRYYQSQVGSIPWLRFTVNTNFLLNNIMKLRERPILGTIVTKMLENFANMTWEDFDTLFYVIEETNIPLPESFALKDIERSWIISDIAPDKDVSKNTLFIRPFLFDELQIAAKGFLSKDYEKNKNPAQCVMIVSVNITGSYDENNRIYTDIIEQLSEIDARADIVKVDATGEGVVQTQINEITEKANQTIMPMIFIVIILVLLISFKRVSYVLLPLFALVISIIWLFGTMVFLGISFTAMSVALVPLIMGLGVDYSVHLSHHYRLELARGKTPAEAIKKSVLEIGAAMFLAMLTTVIAFLSFLSASVPPLRDFGILLALGIIYTFITAITFQASIRYVVDRRKGKLKAKIRKTFKLNIFMGKMAQAILSHQKKIIAVLVLITVVAGVGATQLKTGFDFESFLPSDNPAMDLFEKIERDFPFASQDQEYILLEGDVATVTALRGMKKTHENMEDDTFIARRSDETINTKSVYTIMTQAVNNNASLIEEFNLDEDTMIPRTNRDVQLFYDYLYDSEEYGFMTQNNLHKSEDGRYDAALIKAYIDIISEGREAGDLEEDNALITKELNGDVDSYGNVDVTVTGFLVITHTITTSLTESQLFSTGISLFLAAIVLILAYRKPTLGLITMIPVIISIVWILGTMFFLGYTLNVMTITVTSLTIGIGIDYAIHATERFKLVADRTGDIRAAVTETISKTGGALLIAALTTTLGFGMLIFAPIPPEQQFGVIMCMTISYSFITSVLLLPLLLARWGKWTKKRKGYIISSKPAEADYLEENEVSKEKK